MEINEDFYIYAKEIIKKLIISQFHIYDDNVIEELTQESIIKLSKVIHKYDSNKSQIQTFIWRVSYNRICDVLRKKKRSIDIKYDNDIADTIESKECLFTKVREFLDDEEYEIIELYFKDNRTYKDIAVIYNTYSKDIDRRIKKIIEKIRNEVDLTTLI